jgi:hypothetical protein
MRFSCHICSTLFCLKHSRSYCSIEDDDKPLLEAWEYMVRKQTYLLALVNGDTEELVEKERDGLELCLQKVFFYSTWLEVVHYLVHSTCLSHAGYW